MWTCRYAYFQHVKQKNGNIWYKSYNTFLRVLQLYAKSLILHLFWYDPAVSHVSASRSVPDLSTVRAVLLDNHEYWQVSTYRLCVAVASSSITTTSKAISHSPFELPQDHSTHPSSPLQMDNLLTLSNLHYKYTTQTRPWLSGRTVLHPWMLIRSCNSA